MVGTKGMTILDAMECLIEALHPIPECAAKFVLDGPLTLSGWQQEGHQIVKFCSKIPN